MMRYIPILLLLGLPGCATINPALPQTEADLVAAQEDAMVAGARTFCWLMKQGVDMKAIGIVDVLVYGKKALGKNAEAIRVARERQKRKAAKGVFDE